MESVSVSDLARKMNLKASEVIAKLMGMGEMVTITQSIDHETAGILAAEYGCEVHLVNLYDETVIESEKDEEGPPSEQLVPNWIGKLTIGRLRNYGLISEAVVAVLFILALAMGNNFWLGVLSVILAIVTLLNIKGARMKNKMYKKIGKTFIGNRATFLSHLKFSTLEALLMNRAKSVVLMTGTVFLKRLRQMNYKALYHDEEWIHRVVTSAIYELRPNEKWQQKVNNKTLPEELAPSKKMQENSKLAASMGTTLWYTDKDKAAGMPQAVFAAGQYNLCYNLLDYIRIIETETANTNEAHKLLIACKPQLQEAWKKFQSDPLWMVPKVGD